MITPRNNPKLTDVTQVVYYNMRARAGCTVHVGTCVAKLLNKEGVIRPTNLEWLLATLHRMLLAATTRGMPPGVAYGAT